MRRSPLTGPRPAARHRRAALALPLGALCLLAACSDEPAPGPTTSAPAPTTSSAAPSPEVPSESASSTPSATASPSGSATPSGPSPADGFTTEEQRSPSWPRLGSDIGTGVEVRVGRHSGYDRVVYEFSGTGLPTYRVRYVDEPKDSVSGDPVDVPGEAFLQVGLSSVAVPAEDDPIPVDPPDSAFSGTVLTYAPAIWGGFEGIGEQFIGVSGQERPFRVSVLQDPTRLVVDVAK